jgi:hypothetical protein
MTATAMFLVTASYLLHEFTPEREAELTTLAGRAHDQGESTSQIRIRIWRTADFDAAVRLRRRLALAAGVRATVREL